MGQAMAAPRGELRIIGGEWRRRRIRFPSEPGLRPTPDRIRETLFNWLGPRVVGSCTLDLFAGSGALGLEALSRGAGHVDFVERSRAVAAALRDNLELLGAAERAEVFQAAALAWLESAAGPYDLVFLDPPFDSGLAPLALERLVARALLSPGHRIYLEQRRGAPAAPGWEVLRHAQAGTVEAVLLKRNG